MADTDAVADGLQPLCTLTQTSNDGSGDTDVNIPECAADGTVPDGESVCFVSLIDQPDADGEYQTPTTDDDIQQECIDDGWNLEFRIVRDGPAPGGARVSATCQLSQNKALDCPNLPG